MKGSVTEANGVQPWECAPPKAHRWWWSYAPADLQPSTGGCSLGRGGGQAPEPGCKGGGGMFRLEQTGPFRNAKKDWMWAGNSLEYWWRSSRTTFESLKRRCSQVRNIALHPTSIIFDLRSCIQNIRMPFESPQTVSLIYGEKGVRGEPSNICPD